MSAPDDPEHIDLKGVPTLDINSLTMGEMAEAEIASGHSMTQLLAGPATQRLLALWLQERRSSEKPRSWQQLAALRPFGGRS